MKGGGQGGHTRTHFYTAEHGDHGKSSDKGVRNCMYTGKDCIYCCLKDQTQPGVGLGNLFKTDFGKVHVSVNLSSRNSITFGKLN